MQLENKDKVFEVLNQLLECEMAGVVRYTHYSFMIIGFGRIPIVSWLRSQADESLRHAISVGETITQFGGHPSLGIGKLLETHRHDTRTILIESLQHEKEGVSLYYKLLELVEGKNVVLEEFARTMISEEELHISEVEKMLQAE